jgi:hypothetical protein
LQAHRFVKSAGNGIADREEAAWGLLLQLLHKQ